MVIRSWLTRKAILICRKDRLCRKASFSNIEATRNTILVIKKRHQRGKSQAKGKHDSIINKKKLFQYYSCANYAKSAFEVICLADASRAIFPNFKLHFVKCILNFTRDMQLSKQFQFRSGRSVGQQNCREWLDIII